MVVVEILLLVTFLLGSPFWLLPLVNARRRETALRDLAAQLELKYVPAKGRFFGRRTPPHVAGIRNERHFVFSIARRRWGYRFPDYYRRCVEVAVLNASKAQFVLLTTAQEGVVFKSLFRSQSLLTGDEQFDRKFFIERSVPADYATRLFTSGYLRQRLCETLQGIRRRRIELKDERLKLYETMPWYHLEGGSGDLDYCQQLIDLTMDLAEAADKIASLDGRSHE